MNDNVRNAIRDFEGGFVTPKDPNEKFLSQTMTSEGIPLTARQMNGTERMPGEVEEPSLIDSIKDYVGNAPESVGAPLTNAFESMVNGVSGWAKEKPLYRAVMMTDEEKLLDAQKISGIVGIDAKLLADNQFLYDNAKELADRTAKFAFLNGETFSSENITKLYPEVDLSDPVNAALALKHAKEVLQSRNIIEPDTTITEDIMKAANESWDTIRKSWEAGNKEYEAGELQYRAMSGELSTEEVEEKLKDVEKVEKAYNSAISNSIIATMVGETVKMGTSMTRMTLKGAEEIIAPLGPSLTMALNQMRPMIPYAGVGAAAATGAIAATGATGAAVGVGVAAAGAVAGAIALSKAAVYTGTYRAEAGGAYWDWITKKDSTGRNLYTRDQALAHARRVGHMNAFIETASLDMALNGISKAIGPSAALAVIRNKAAMESLIGAGRGAIAKEAGLYAGKQVFKTATPEVLEEGLQQAVGDIDENIFGKERHSTREIMGNAVEAMIQAIPASVGMALGGAAIAGVGTYRGMRRISKLSSADIKDTVTEFKRENEKSLIQNLISQRDSASLFKKSPEAYQKTIQKQLEDNALGTIYIDVQTAAENENTHAALNQLVEDGTITAQELDKAIQEGKPLEVETGKFMQTATPEIHEALSDYTTMDKGEKTLHAIREERERYKAMMDITSMTKEKREAAATQKILEQHFSTDTEQGREDRATAAELLSGGIDKLQENYKAMLDEAKTLWGNLTGVKTYQDYLSTKEAGVEFTWTKDKDGFDVSKRITNNEPWYQDFWATHDRAPNQRELYDVAHNNVLAEHEYKTDEETIAGLREMEEAKKRVESIERVGETLKSLGKEDLIAQTLLDPETYEEAYKPLLEQITKAGNKEVAKAARDSALILAKIAENFHKNYGVPLKLATIAAGKVSPQSMQQLHQAIREQQGFSDKAKDIILDEVKKWNKDTVPGEEIDEKLYNDLLGMSNEELFKKAKTIVSDLVGDPKNPTRYTDPLGNEIYFAPGDTETLDQYTLHLAAGMGKEIKDIRAARVLGIVLAKKTIENPLAIVTEDSKLHKGDARMEDREVYISSYKGVNGYANTMVIGVEKDQNGRVITSTLTVGDKRKKGKAVYEIKKVFRTSKKLLYVRGVNNRDSLSGHSRPPSDHWVSTLNAKLHPIGNYIIAQEELENNENMLYQMAGVNAKTAPISRLHKRENPAYYQTAHEEDLVAMHNIEERNLMAAIELGGFPVPSIAITKKQTPYTGFGDITLIMNKDTVDPAKTPVFSRDAWTGVFPKIIRKANIKRLQDFIENFIEPQQKELPRNFMNYGELYGSARLFSAKNNGDVQYMLERSLGSDGYKYYFLKSIGDTPKAKWKKRGLDNTLSEHPAILKACQELEKNHGEVELKEILSKGHYDLLEENDLKKVNDLLVKELSADIAESKSPFVRRTQERKQRRLASGETLHALLSSYLKRNEKIFDQETFDKQLEKKIKVHAKEYEAWKDSFRNEMLGDPVIQENGKPATLDNIAAAMVGELKNAQKSFAGYGIGNIIASSAKKMKSVDELHKVADKQMDPSTDIETGMDTSEQYTHAKDEIAKFMEEMANAYKLGDRWESQSDAAQVLMAVMQGKSFKAAAEKFGFDHSPELEAHAKEIVKEVKALPAKYFEAKPQRAVHFNEVAAAVMPKNTSKEVKDHLRAQGVTIRLYDPKIEGERERVTNSAQDKAKQYFQSGTTYQGSYDKSTNVIELFDGANESTVIHEGAHMFLSTLERMAALDIETLSGYFQGDAKKAAASLAKMQADLTTIREWASFSEERLGEYKGTALEKEFTQHAADIKAGKAGAEERWLQERFARGFEKYLMEGSAPTKEMQGVFRRFKKWLTDIYKTTKNLGNVTFDPKVKDIFDKLIATEDEINAWAAQRKLESIDKIVDVNRSEMGNLKAWAESVKDKALEKAMSYYLRMVKEDAIEDFRNAISSEDQKMEFIKSLGEENEIYQIETIYNSDTFPTAKDKKDFLTMSGHTEESFKQKLKEAGGTTEERWNAHIEDMLTHYKEEALTSEAVQQMAEDILNSPEGLQKKSRIEAMLLEKKVTQYINLVTSMQLELKRSKDKEKTAREIRKRLGLVSEKETTELDKQSETIAKSEEKIAKLEKQKADLKEKLAKAQEEASKSQEEKNQYKEAATTLEGNLRAIEHELQKERAAHEKDNATREDTRETIIDLSVQLKTMAEGLRESRNAMKIDLALIKEDARNTLGGESLSHATSWRWWLNKAQIEEGRAMQAAAKNDWDGAAYHKQAQAQCLIMSKEARKNEDEIRCTLHGGGGKVTTALLNENGMEKYGILGILNRISRTDKPVLMRDDARYFVQHMAYVLGMAKKDGILPIDDKGQERAFNWHWLAVEMNPMQAMDNPNYMAEDIIPSWMRQAFDGQPQKLSSLTMDQFREMAKVMKAVYKLGRREYEGNTLGVSFDKATEDITNEIYDNWTHRKVIPQVKAQTDTTLDRVKAKAHSLTKDITLPEILIERMGKNAYEYFYKPIDRATTHLRELKQSARKIFRANFDTYSRKEWTSMRSERLYTYGIDDRGNPMQWTKEQVIAMALNFGTKSNRQRLIETLWGNEADLLNFLDKNLTNKDWDFVEKVWTHLNSYWGERNKVQNDLYGTPLGKVPGETFTLKSGRVIQGQYYRIKYDPNTSSKTGRNQANDIARMDMENTSAFSLGMGSTKQRAAMSGGQKLRLDLDVYVEAVNEAMQHIAMREATVDVYKLLTRKEIVQAFELTTGPETIRMLQEWAKDNWHSSIKEMAEWDSMLGRARRRFNFTTMGFRLSTALLNIGNITGMMDRMGAANALKACWDFYKNPTDIREQVQFIQAKSSMMNDRRATIDRDMYLQDKIPVGKNESKLRSLVEHGKYGVDALNKNAYWFIQFTDGLFSYPEWLHTYRTSLVELEAEGRLSREDMDKEAIRRADKMVRETFGSNEIKDQTQFSRDNGILAQMTSFFSYTNLVTNQFIRAGYILYDKRDIKPLLAATWYWWVLGAAVETAIRASADDSDDEDKWFKKAIHTAASNGPFGGVPLFREIIPWTVDYFVGKKPFGSAAPDAPAFDMVKHTENFLKAVDKGDYIEAGRGATKAITRSSIPVPDTIVDAFWNFMRMATTDNDYTVRQFIWKSLWDKSMKKGGENK